MKRRRAEARLRFAAPPPIIACRGRHRSGGRVVNLKELMMILELHRQGLSVSAISERTGHDRKTVRKYIREGLVVPKYKPRTPRPTLIGPFEDYLRERIAAWPELTGARLLREIRALGYGGGKTALTDFLRQVRPRTQTVFEVRFETPAGQQAQVDFAEFRVEFDDEPGLEHKVWLFAMVLGHSRYLWAQYVLHQDLGTVLRCHMEAFEHFGGVPREILYDRMKSAVLGEVAAEQSIIYNDKLLKCGAHYGFVPRACQPYRAKTKALTSYCTLLRRLGGNDLGRPTAVAAAGTLHEPHVAGRLVKTAVVIAVQVAPKSTCAPQLMNRGCRHAEMARDLFSGQHAALA
jgi:transposase